MTIFTYKSYGDAVAKEYHEKIKIDTTSRLDHPTADHSHCTAEADVADAEKLCCEDSTHSIDRDNKCCASSDLLPTGATITTINNTVTPFNETTPTRIRNLRVSTSYETLTLTSYCLTLATGDVTSDLITWKCEATSKESYQTWYKEEDGKIRSGFDTTMCVSIGANAVEKDKIKLELCAPDGIEDISYLQWESDEDGRIKNKKFTDFYIGVNQGCHLGVTSGAYLEAQVKYDQDSEYNLICPKYNSQFWDKIGTNEVTTAEVVCKTHIPANTTFTREEEIKFRAMTESLIITVHGYGIGLDQSGSEKLFARSIDDYNGIMDFIVAESKTLDYNRNYVGRVYGLTVTPWADHVPFQELTNLTGDTVKLVVVQNDPDKAPCTDPTHVVDKNDVCCHPSTLYDYAWKKYPFINLAQLDDRILSGSTVTDEFNSIDGDFNTIEQRQSSDDSDTTWLINFGGVHEIRRVYVYRDESTGDQNNDGFDVIIYDGAIEVKRESIASSALTPTVQVIEVDSGLFGSRVEIMLGVNKILRLKEVEVYGYEHSGDLEIRNAKNTNKCITLARGNTSNDLYSLITWECGYKSGERKNRRWQQWYFTREGYIRSRLDTSKCITPKDGAAAVERGTFVLSDCIDEEYQQWIVDADGRIQNKQLDTLYIGLSSGCTTVGVSDGDVLEFHKYYDSTTEECNTSSKYKEQWWSLSALPETDLRCRPTESFQTITVKENLMTNAEFLSRMDIAIRHREAQLASLQSCISATKYFPESDNYYILKSMNYDGTNNSAEEKEFTVAELKAAIDPFNDYSFYLHIASELDEYISTYVSSCMRALHLGSDSHADTDHDYLLQNNWANLPQCSDTTCLDVDARWSRKATKGCVAGWMTGNLAPSFDTDDSECYKSMTSFTSSNNNECQYKTSDLNAYLTKAQSCWNNIATLSTKSISYFTTHFCNPRSTGNVLETTKQADLGNKISTYCTTPSRRRLMFRENLRSKRELAHWKKL